MSSATLLLAITMPLAAQQRHVPHFEAPEKLYPVLIAFLKETS